MERLHARVKAVERYASAYGERMWEASPVSTASMKVRSHRVPKSTLDLYVTPTSFSLLRWVPSPAMVPATVAALSRGFTPYSAMLERAKGHL